VSHQAVDSSGQVRGAGTDLGIRNQFRAVGLLQARIGAPANCVLAGDQSPVRPQHEVCPSPTNPTPRLKTVNRLAALVELRLGPRLACRPGQRHAWAGRSRLSVQSFWTSKLLFRESVKMSARGVRLRRLGRGHDHFVADAVGERRRRRRPAGKSAAGSWAHSVKLRKHGPAALRARSRGPTSHSMVAGGRAHLRVRLRAARRWRAWTEMTADWGAPAVGAGGADLEPDHQRGPGEVNRVVLDVSSKAPGPPSSGSRSRVSGSPGRRVHASGVDGMRPAGRAESFLLAVATAGRSPTASATK